MAEMNTGTGETVTIPKKEYERLLSFKEAFMEKVSMEKRQGDAYRKYKELKETDEFMRRRFREQYLAMLKIQREEKKNAELAGFQ